jgi:hypothetical protein
MDAKNACNGGKANGSYLDNGRANEFQSACSIRYVHDPIADMPASYDTALNKINTPERVVRHDMHQLLVQGAISHGYIRRVHVG